MPQQVGNQQNFLLTLESTPELLSLSESSIRGFRKILFVDSIFNFFPWVEVYIRDPNGIIPDVINFIEGLDIEVSLGNESSGYIGGNFYSWIKNEFNDITITESLSGVNAFIFGHRFIKYNGPKNRSWRDTIKNIINDILTKDYSFTTSSKKFISNTTGVDYWYQSYKRNSTWIQDIADEAYDSAHPKSPYYTFFNSAGEFYFMHLYDLFSQQPINNRHPYLLQMREGTMTNPYSIQDYIIEYPGVEINFPNYKFKTFRTEVDGSVSKETHELKNHVFKDGPNKMTIKKSFTNINNFIYLGNYESITDQYNYQGLVNSVLKDSVLAYRMRITVPFNPKLTSGKIIELEISSAFRNRNKLKEFSGKWLILKSVHYMDSDALPYTNLHIAKSTVFVDRNHLLYNEFIL